MSINDGSRRPSFKDSIKAALSPREPVSIDPDAPNPVPSTVRIAGWLGVASGVLNGGLGVITMLQREPYIRQVQDQVAECKAQGIGVGEAVTTTETSELVTICRGLGDFTAAQYDGARSALLTTAIALLIVGALGIWAGLGVVRGRVWARRVLTAVGVVLLVATMLQLVVSPLVLLAALLLLIALALVYVGKGATYFIRAKAKGVR